MISESTVELAALEWFSDLGYETENGPKVAPGEGGAERTAYDEVVLVGRLLDALANLNPAIPEEAREEALRKVLRVGTRHRTSERTTMNELSSRSHAVFRMELTLTSDDPFTSGTPTLAGNGRGVVGWSAHLWDGVLCVFIIYHIFHT